MKDKSPAENGRGARRPGREKGEYMVLKRGDCISARTNAELLNQIFHTTWRAWMRCRYPFGGNYAVLLHNFGHVTHAGWRNVEQADGTVSEVYCGEETRKRKSHRGVPWGERHVLFEKRTEEKVFIFRGIYVLPERGSDRAKLWKIGPDHRVWMCVSDTFDSEKR